MRTYFSSFAGTALLLAGGAANAEPAQTDRTLAESLFDQAKQLMASGDYASACPKLEESQRLDPGGGTLLNLALCHEQEGKIATAWAEFKVASSAAKRDGREDRIAAAEEHILALRPKLPWLTLQVETPAEGQEVAVDGTVLRNAAWSAPLSVDPGTHDVRATAQGRMPWSTKVNLSVAEQQTVRVPALKLEPVAAAAAVQPPPPHEPSLTASDHSVRRTIGWASLGTGVAFVGIGTYFGIRTITTKHQSDELCPTNSTCSDRGVQLIERAQTYAWLANVGVGLGIAGIGVGTYLLVTSDPERAAAQHPHLRAVSLQFGPVPRGAGATLGTTW